MAKFNTLNFLKSLSIVDVINSKVNVHIGS